MFNLKNRAVLRGVYRSFLREANVLQKAGIELPLQRFDTRLQDLFPDVDLMCSPETTHLNHNMLRKIIRNAFEKNTKADVSLAYSYLGKFSKILFDEVVTTTTKFQISDVLSGEVSSTCFLLARDQAGEISSDDLDKNWYGLIFRIKNTGTGKIGLSKYRIGGMEARSPMKVVSKDNTETIIAVLPPTVEKKNSIVQVTLTIIGVQFASDHDVTFPVILTHSKCDAIAARLEGDGIFDNAICDKVIHNYVDNSKPSFESPSFVSSGSAAASQHPYPMKPNGDHPKPGSSSWLQK